MAHNDTPAAIRAIESITSQMPGGMKMREITNSTLREIDRAIQDLRKIGAHIYDSESFKFRLTVIVPGHEPYTNQEFLDLPDIANRHCPQKAD